MKIILRYSYNTWLTGLDIGLPDLSFTLSQCQVASLCWANSEKTKHIHAHRYHSLWGQTWLSSSADSSGGIKTGQQALDSWYTYHRQDWSKFTDFLILLLTRCLGRFHTWLRCTIHFISVRVPLQCPWLATNFNWASRSSYRQCGIASYWALLTELAMRYNTKYNV